MQDRNFRISLVLSVFPAPLSPLRGDKANTMSDDRASRAALNMSMFPKLHFLLIELVDKTTWQYVCVLLAELLHITCGSLLLSLIHKSKSGCTRCFFNFPQIKVYEATVLQSTTFTYDVKEEEKQKFM